MLFVTNSYDVCYSLLLLKDCVFLLFVVGYEVYLVGGCVRDLILKRTPKDFDIITSAELKEVNLNFNFVLSL